MCNVTTLRKCLPFEWDMVRVQWKELPELESCRHINGVRIDARLLYATYRKIASFNTSRLEAHVGFFRLLMKGIFGPYVL